MRPARRHTAAGFTLAEVAVTLAVVGLALVWMLQALNTAKFSAAQTRNLKLARELALMTLGQIESGLYREEIDDGLIEGTYAEEGYPEFAFQAAIGDDNLPPAADDPAFDNWLEERRQQELDSDEESEVEQAYERVQVRVIFPALLELPHELVLERWLPWALVHYSEEQEAQEDAAGAGQGSPEGGAQ